MDAPVNDLAPKKRRRWRLVVRLAVGLFLLALGTVLAILYLTPLPERAAEHFLTEALARNGGRLTVQDRSGSLAAGLDLKGLELDLPDGTRLTVDHVHLKLGKGALLLGIIHIKELVLEKPSLVLVLPEEAKKPKSSNRGAALPMGLRLSASGVRIGGGRLEMRRAGADRPEVMEAIDARLDASLFLQRLSLHVESLDVLPVGYVPGPVHAGGTLNLTPDGGGRFDGSAAFCGSSVRGRGSWKPGAGGAGPSYRASLTLAPLALRDIVAFWPGAPDLAAEGTARVEGSEGSLRYDTDVKVAGAGAVAGRGSVTWHGGAWEVKGQVKSPALRLDKVFGSEALRGAVFSGKGTGRVFGKDGGFSGWAADAELGKGTIYGLSWESASVKGSGDASVLSASGPLVSDITGDAVASVEGAYGGAWRVTASAPHLPFVKLLDALKSRPDLPAGITLPEGAWAVAHSDCLVENGAVTIQAALTDPGGGHWDVDTGPVRGDDFAALKVRFSGVDTGAYGLSDVGRLTGNVAFSGRASGDWDMTVGLDSLRWEGIAAKPFTARLRRGGGVIRLDDMALETSAGRASVGGTLDGAGKLDARVEAHVGDVAALQEILGGQKITGGLEAALHVTGAFPSPRIEGRAVLTQATFSGLAVEEAHCEGLWDQKGGNDLTLSWKGAQLNGQVAGAGRVTLGGPPGSSRLGVDAEMGPDRDISFVLQGPLDLHRGEGVLSKARVANEGKVFDQDGEARLAWSREAVSLEGLAVQKKNSRLLVSLQVGLGGSFGSAAVEGKLGASHIPLGLLPIPETAGVMGGILDADLHWSGTIDAPVIAGTADIREGVYRLPESDRVISPIAVSLRAEGDKLTITSASATTPQGGEASASGFIRFRGFLPSEFGLSAQGRDFPFVIGKDMDGVADFSATLKGTPLQPKLDGSAHIKKGRIQLPETERQQALPETIRFTNAPLGSPFHARGSEARSEPGMLRGSFRLTCDGALWISSRNLIAEVAGNLTVHFTAKGPTLEGALDVLQGRFLFQGRKFELTDSKVSFSGTTDLMPYLAVQAVYTAEDAEVTIHIDGPAKKPQLRFTSVPPMEQADIVSTLVYGRRRQDLSSGDMRSSASAGAGALALYGTAPVLDSVKSALGLDSMAVGMGTGTQVSFSKSLGDNVVLQYQETFGSLPNWRADLRYRLNKSYSIQAEGNSNGTSGLDLFWEHRY